MSIQRRISIRGVSMYAWCLPANKQGSYDTLKIGDVCLFGNGKTNIFFASVRCKFDLAPGEEPWGHHPRVYRFGIELDRPVDTRCSYQKLARFLGVLRPTKASLQQPRKSIASCPMMTVSKKYEIERIVQLLRESMDS